LYASVPRGGVAAVEVPAAGAIVLGMQPPTEAMPRSWSPSQQPMYCAMSPPEPPPATKTCFVSTQYFELLSAFSALKEARLSVCSLPSSQPVLTYTVFPSLGFGGVCRLPGWTCVMKTVIAPAMWPAAARPQQSP